MPSQFISAPSNTPTATSLTYDKPNLLPVAVLLLAPPAILRPLRADVQMDVPSLAWCAECPGRAAAIPLRDRFPRKTEATGENRVALLCARAEEPAAACYEFIHYSVVVSCDLGGTMSFMNTLEGTRRRRAASLRAVGGVGCVSTVAVQDVLIEKVERKKSCVSITPPPTDALDDSLPAGVPLRLNQISFWLRGSCPDSPGHAGEQLPSG
ncbi:hypothetical protein EYF80_030709 [Liparis tanakae]|uniref:Uncharacterized protein n=1 Tax=Liparis tanakae TaxID=230148 RepID=A0A4Z2H156_9TELE|nr:hypothetical protein EYF80_030709 [Liparis tanakae]